MGDILLVKMSIKADLDWNVGMLFIIIIIAIFDFTISRKYVMYLKLKELFIVQLSYILSIFHLIGEIISVIYFSKSMCQVHCPC